MAHKKILIIILISIAVATFGASDLFAQAEYFDPAQQQGTFSLETPTPLPTNTPQPPTPTSAPTTAPPNAGVTHSVIITGGPQGPDSPYYCIDDEDPEPCDDNTSFLVRKGSGGIAGSCGTVIEWAQKIAAALPQADKQMRDKLLTNVSNPCHFTGTYASGYISTFFVIDSYNLAGFKDLSKSNPAHIRGTDLLAWWKNKPTGYAYTDYESDPAGHQAIMKRDLTGTVMFLKLPSGNVHVGVVNSVDLDAHGHGIIAILQSGTRYWLDRFEVVNYNIMNTPLHQTQISGVAGFGGH